MGSPGSRERARRRAAPALRAASLVVCALLLGGTLPHAAAAPPAPGAPAVAPAARLASAAPVRAPAPSPPSDLAEARKVIADPESRTHERVRAAVTLMTTGKRKNTSKVVDALLDVDSREDFPAAVLPVARPALLDDAGAVDDDVVKRVSKLAASSKLERKVHGLHLAALLELDGLDGEALELLVEVAADLLRNDRREPGDRQDTRALGRAADVACSVLARVRPPDPQFLWQLQMLRNSALAPTRQLAYAAYVRLGAAPYASVLAGALADDSRAIQDLAYEALLEARRPELVPALIGQLGQTPDPAVSARVLPRLFRATGQRYRSRSQWDKWLERTGEFLVLSEEEFEIAQTALVEAYARSRYGPQGSFFSRPVEPGHVVFLLDVSGSMSAGVTPPAEIDGVEVFLPAELRKRSRMDLLRSQVRNALEGLDDQDFDIVVFSNGVRRWRPDGNRGFDTREAAVASAKAFITELEPGGGTALHAGLEAALGIEGVQQVFVLSDGTPTTGETDLNTIMRDARRWSKRAGGVVMHCISIGDDHPLLEALAGMTKGGSYTEVEVPD